MKKTYFFIFLLMLIAYLSSAAFADTVKLNNGGTIRGVIKEEAETSVTIAIGMGTMTIPKSEIKDIRRSDAKENTALENAFRKAGIERGSFVPPGMEELARKLEQITGDRKNLEKAKSELDSTQKEIDDNSKKLEAMKSDFEEKNRQIRKVDPQDDVKDYNKSISELNALNLELSAQSEKINKLNRKLPELQRAYWKAITVYGNEIGDFKIYFEKQVETVNNRTITEDESLYFNLVKKSLSELEKGLTTDVIDITKDEHGMIVRAVLDGKLTCTLAVDTGAAVVVLSKSTADKLETNPKETVLDVEFTLADGSVIKSRLIKIKSVTVGNSTVHNVTAAVTDSPPWPGIDGLLGMSFLNNFNIKMDVANGRLILETVK